MKAKDISGCEDCPLLDNHCSGGMTSGAGGDPIEPPCCSWSPDDEVSEDDMDMKIEACIQDQEAERDYEEKLNLKKEEKNKKARESRLYVYGETAQIRRLKKRYSGLARLKSFASAFSITNKIMRMPENSKIKESKSKIEIEMDQIIIDIENVKIVKKKKLKELRDIRNTEKH